MHINADIYHLLAETFMCIFSLELLQWSTLNSPGKNVLLCSWYEESAYKSEGFVLNGLHNPYHLPEARETTGEWGIDSIWFLQIFDAGTFPTIAGKESAICILPVRLHFLCAVKASFILIFHSSYWRTWPSLHSIPSLPYSTDMAMHSHTC